MADVGTATHRYTDVGPRQSRGVINAVPDHHHPPTVDLEGRHPLCLLLREDTRKHALDAELTRDRRGRPSVVAGDEHDLAPQPPQTGDLELAVRPDGIGHGEDTRQLAVHSDQHGAPPFPAQAFHVRCGRVGVHPLFFQEALAACYHFVPGHDALHPEPGVRLEI